MSNWKAIETAPKDRRILLSKGGRGLFAAGKWDSDEFAKNPRPYWRTDIQSWMGIRWMRAHRPTHWMDPSEVKL